MRRTLYSIPPGLLLAATAAVARELGPRWAALLLCSAVLLLTGIVVWFVWFFTTRTPTQRADLLTLLLGRVSDPPRPHPRAGATARTLPRANGRTGDLP